MSKKLSSQDLEQDLLIEYSSRFMFFYNRNKAAVIGGGIGVVLLIGLVIGYFVWSNQQEREAQVLLGIAEQHFTEGNFELALEGDESAFTLGFIQIANNYGRTDAGNLANYYAAVAESELGNYESALLFIEKFSPPRGIVGVSPISFYANVLLELEEYEQAARMFERAAGWDQNDATTPYNLYQAAQAYIEAGMNRPALEHLETILNDYPTSRQADQARRLKGLQGEQ